MEDSRSQESGICGQLCRTMYGTLDAAEQWAIHYTAVLEAAGFQKGASSPCHFWHPQKDIWALVHGDDFVSVAEGPDQDYLHKILSDAYEVKMTRAGLNASEARQIRVLGRIISVSEQGWQVEADPQHLEVAIAQLNLTEAKGVSTPVATDHGAKSAAEIKRIRLELEKPDRSSANTVDCSCPPLPDDKKKVYQSIAARLNYLALDRPDIGFGVKELMRRMSCPDEGDMQALKRICRYLITMPRLAYLYHWQPLSDNVTISGDANWAGCVRTRKSTLGGVATWGGLVLKTWSNHGNSRPVQWRERAWGGSSSQWGGPWYPMYSL